MSCSFSTTSRMTGVECNAGEAGPAGVVIPLSCCTDDVDDHVSAYRIQ